MAKEVANIEEKFEIHNLLTKAGKMRYTELKLAAANTKQPLLFEI